MLVRQAPDQLDMYRAELCALLERQLVMLKHCASGARRAYLTGKGRTFLDSHHPDEISRSRKSPCNGNVERLKTRYVPGGRTTDIVVPGLAS